MTTPDLAGMLTPELRFAAACSYVPATAHGLARQKEQLKEAFRQGHELGTLWTAIRRHRIFASAERALREHRMEHVLAGLHLELKRKAKGVRLQNMRLLSAAAELAAQLSEAGIEHCFLKGPHLSQKIYGDAGLRHSKDLDLLVRPEHFSSTSDVLLTNGWKPLQEEAWGPSGLNRRIAERRLRHLQFVHESTKVGLELHWRIEAVYSPALEEKWWSLLNTASPGVSPAEFLHLCLHGTAHGWSRLKWLGDLAAIYDRDPNLWQTSAQSCAALGLERAVAQARLLLHVVYGFELERSGSPPRLCLQAAFSIGEMKAGDPNRKLTAREWWKRHRYFAAFKDRYSVCDRFINKFIVGLCDEDQVLQKSSWWIARMPFVRALGVYRRYVMTGNF